MMTAYGDINTSVEAIKRGAFQYICKPVNIEELRLYINQALEFQHLSRRVESLSSELEELEQRTYYGDIIGKSEPMQKIYQMIDRVKNVDSSVVITGESGTGKELVARAIHKNGPRAKENFVSVNCAAIPEGLLEEEFFGHVKGSFTGAMADKKGKLELADHGTLFLDEVGDMPLSLQGKLLRVLQEKEMMPIGSTSYKKIDVRVICATNRDLLAMVQKGTFRNDLYYRLHVINIHVPPLRERKQDIPELSANILKRLAGNMKRTISGFTPEAFQWCEIEKTVCKKLDAYSSLLQKLDVPKPWYLSVCITNGKGYWTDSYGEESAELHSDYIQAVDVIWNDGQTLNETIQPCLDSLANAFGFPKSFLDFSDNKS